MNAKELIKKIEIELKDPVVEVYNDDIFIYDNINGCSDTLESEKCNEFLEMEATEKEVSYEDYLLKNTELKDTYSKNDRFFVITV